MKNIKLIKEVANYLFPINRSLTGNGNIKTLKYIKNKINKNLIIKKVKSNFKCYDWKVPKEWNIKEATLTDQNGKIICDFKRNNLEVLGYSYPVNKILNFNQLKNHLFFLKEKPNIIPYVTSYYKKNWGFCLKYHEYKKLNKKSKFKVIINSKIKKGNMVYGELTIPGKSKKTILITSYICHPSLAINELSGILSLCYLMLNIKKSYYTVKLILIPETIGPIYYIKKNESFLKKNLIAGINLTCTGLKGPYTKISSISENTYIDRIFDRIGKNYKNFRNISFLKRGSNERQFGCQNLKLPFVTFCRQRFGDYKEYHTSADNLNIMNYVELIKSSFFIKKIIDEIQKNRIYIKKVIGEPFLQKYKLVNSIGTLKNMRLKKRSLISNIIAYVDKNVDLKYLSEKFNTDISKIHKIIKVLEQKKILKKI